MSALEKLRQRSLKALIDDIDLIDAAHLERLAHLLIHRWERRLLIQRGITIEGRASGYTVDSFTSEQDAIIECSTLADYFKDPFTKIREDIAHARESNRECRRLYLVSSRLCRPSDGNAVAAVLRAEAFGECQIECFDARMIAEMVFDHAIVGDTDRDVIEDLVPAVDPRASSSTMGSFAWAGLFTRDPQTHFSLCQQLYWKSMAGCKDEP